MDQKTAMRMWPHRRHWLGFRTELYISGGRISVSVILQQQAATRQDEVHGSQAYERHSDNRPGLLKQQQLRDWCVTCQGNPQIL